MFELVPTITTVLSTLTAVAQVMAVVILFGVIFKVGWIRKFFGENAQLFAFVVATVAMLGSLFYSEIAGFAPCALCWYQRVAMYPMVVIFAVSFFVKNSRAFLYTTALSVIGTVFATLHYILQVSSVKVFSCGSVGYSVSCSERFFLNFGYITIAMMALSAFVLILSLALIRRMYAKSQGD